MVSSFYENTTVGSNVVDCPTFLSNVYNTHTNFDKAEFDKDVREVDWKKVVESLDMDKITSKWELPEVKGGAKGKSTSI